MRSNEIGYRIASVRGDLSQSDFARQIGIHKNTLARYERGERKPDADVLLRLRELGVNPDWVLTGEGNMMLADSSTTLCQDNDEFDYVSRWNIEVSAGPGAAEPSTEIKVEDIAFRKDWLKSQGLTASRLAILTARGDSMEPTIMHNDMLLVDVFANQQQLQTVPQDGIYIIRLDGHLHAKRLQSDGRGGILVKSDNRAYDTIHLSKGELSNIQVLGRVVWVGRTIA